MGILGMHKKKTFKTTALQKPSMLGRSGREVRKVGEKVLPNSGAAHSIESQSASHTEDLVTCSAPEKEKAA